MKQPKLENRERDKITRPRAVFLVGFMGAGKSSVGNELGLILERRFVDLDERIVAFAGQSIPDIFRQRGEDAFRELESTALKNLLEEIGSGTNLVVALGGGAYVQQANEALLRKSGFPVIFLDAELEELRSRCAEAAGTRPLFQDAGHFGQLYRSRRPAYQRADITIDTTSKSIRQVAEEIIGALDKRK